MQATLSGSFRGQLLPDELLHGLLRRDRVEQEKPDFACGHLFAA